MKLFGLTAGALAIGLSFATFNVITAHEASAKQCMGCPPPIVTPDAKRNDVHIKCKPVAGVKKPGPGCVLRPGKGIRMLPAL